MYYVQVYVVKKFTHIIVYIVSNKPIYIYIIVIYIVYILDIIKW